MVQKLLIPFLALMAVSCNNNKIKEYTDSPTSGEITIAVDETFKPIVDSEIEAFTYYYKNAHIKAAYVPEGTAFKSLLNDSARLVIAARGLNENEKDYFKSIQLTPKITRIAIDAIALIIHPDNPDTVLTYDQVGDILRSKTRLWTEINPKSTGKEINIVFDNSASSTARYMRDQFLDGKNFGGNCAAVNTNEEVIEYCSSHINAIGLIGVNWISDGDDPASLGFKKKIKVIAVSPPETAEGAGSAYKPYQAFIGQKFYPFTRDIYIISREARSGLASGFAAFVAGDKGQRIILKSGIMPATKPVRIVDFKSSGQ
jgi:phosphate transport system substrate-binding protein